MFKTKIKAGFSAKMIYFILFISSCQNYIELPTELSNPTTKKSENAFFDLDEQKIDYSNFRLGDWNIFYEETFEGPERPFYAYTHTQFPKSHSFQLSSSVSVRGKNSGKFELRKGDPMVTDTGIRSEVLFGTPPSNDMWYSFALYLPSSGFAKDRDNDILSQWHQGSGSPPISLRVVDDRFVFRYNSSSNLITDFDLGSAEKNTWHRFVFRVLHSSSSDGSVEIWRNGTKILSRKSVNMYNRELPRWKVGIYKPTWEKKKTDTDLRVLYLDNIRIGTGSATLAEMDPLQDNLKGWGPYIPSIKTFTIINTVTQKEVGKLQEGGKINVKLLNTDKINIRADFEEQFSGSVLFDLKGAKNALSTDNNFPFTLYGESSKGIFYNGGGTPVGTYKLNLKTFAETSRNGKVGEETSISFSVIDQDESVVEIPKISGFNLIKANVDQIYGPLRDGDIIDLKKVGTYKLSIQALVHSSFKGEIRFRMTGRINRTFTSLTTPYTIYGYSNGNYAFGSTGLPSGDYSLEATPVVLQNGLTNIGTPATIRFKVVDDGSALKNLSPIESLTLIKANTNTDWGEISDGAVFLAAQIGTHKLTIRANMRSDFKGRLLFQLIGRVNRTSFSTSFPPYVLNNYLNGNYSFGEGLPPGKYDLNLTPLIIENGTEKALPVEKWTFEIK
jgi:hypothetical protein